MDPEAELLAALSEWRRLAEAIGKAIREGNWNFVAECQSAISQLRPSLDRVTGQNRQNSASPTAALSSGTRKATARAIVLDLIELEKRNLASIRERREKLAAHVAQLGRTNRNLRGIQRSYAPPLPSAWNSYS
jgi:hypothetical protein